MKPLLKNTTSRIPFALGITVLLLIGYFQLNNLASGLISKVANEEAEAAQSPLPEDRYSFIACPGKTNTDKNVSFVPTRLVINKINVNLPIVSQPMKNGTWAVTPKAANYAEGTSAVSRTAGNVGIFGHDRADALTKIKDLAEGDTIELFDAGHKAIYRVQSASVVKPDQVDVFYPSDKSLLTIVTCEGVFSQSRYAVKAELISIEDLNCPVENK